MKANVEVSVCIDEGKKNIQKHTHTVHHEHWEYNNCQSTCALFFKWHRHYHYECEAIRKHQITIVCQRDWEFIMRACTTQKLIRCTGFHLYSIVSKFRVKAQQQTVSRYKKSIQMNDIAWKEGFFDGCWKNCVQTDLNQLETNVFSRNHSSFRAKTTTQHTIRIEKTWILFNWF